MPTKPARSSRPYVIQHCLGSLDGRVVQTLWELKDASRYFEEPAAKIKADA